MNEPNKRKPCDHCGTAERAKGVRFCSVCIKVKRNFNLWHTSWGWWNTIKYKSTKCFVVI